MTNSNILETIYSNEEGLAKILNNDALSEVLKLNIDKYVQNNTTTTQQYLETILYVLTELNKNVLSTSNTFMSINEYRNVKMAIEIVISIGIIPCLLPAICQSLCSTDESSNAKLTVLEKYNCLATTTRVLVNLYKEISVKPAILTQLRPILGALFQLAHAPLSKPRHDYQTNELSSQFNMTQELYSKLKNDQNDFCQQLEDFIKNSSQSSIMKELMFLSGKETAPAWLKRQTKIYLIRAIVEPNGIMSLINATCEDTSLDLGMHWNKLMTISRLIACSHGNNKDQYYNLICNQLINLLTTKTLKNATIIANSCIMALYEVQPKICTEKIIDIIAAPLMVSYPSHNIETTETQLTECIENLTKCFVPSNDAKFKYLPCVLLKKIAIPLFCMYTKLYQSASLLKNKVNQLLTQLLNDDKLCNNLFAAYLEHHGHCEDKHDDYFGEKLSFQFGSTGNLVINNNETMLIESNEYSNDLVANSLFYLVKEDQRLCLMLLNYLLNWLITLNFNSITAENQLNTPDDIGNLLFKQMAAMKLLSDLTSMNTVRQSLIKSPESLLSLIKSLFQSQLSNNDVGGENLYTSLMLVKLILVQGDIPDDWMVFNNFADFLKTKINIIETTSIPMRDLMTDLIETIRKKGKIRRNYQDMNKDNSEFDKAIKDLADPLLPVRAHGLITLTKLIEISDTEALAKRKLILYMFQENLKDDDSFIYLTAINGLCTMAQLYPEEIIEILVQEFIDMPQRNVNGDIEPENRAKLGEILVKTTKALGEMASKYKNILINGFLCAIRDPDSLVRSSSLSCLGELCKVLGFRLGNAVTEILYCLECIIETDKAQECRRAAVLVMTLLIRGLDKDTLMDLGSNLLPVYRRLKHLRDNDTDDVLRLHAQLALEEIDHIVKNTLLAKPVMEKTIFLLT